MRQETIVGCGGGLDMKCSGGCLKIHKILYSCKEQEVSNDEQLRIVQALCDKKHKCRVEASREMFGHEECPDTPDNEMIMWVVYSCDGGEDGTRLKGPKTCSQPRTEMCTCPCTGTFWNNCLAWSRPKLSTKVENTPPSSTHHHPLTQAF